MLKAEPIVTKTPQFDFVDIRETTGGVLYSIRWANVEAIVDQTDDAEPFFVLYMVSGEQYTVKDPACFNAIKDRRKDKH